MSWAYEERGSAGAADESWVLLHEILGNRASFADVAAQLAANGLRVVCADLPGHGATACPNSSVTLDALVEQLAAFLDEIAVDAPVICGTSLGALLAGELALRHPDKISGLALISWPARPFLGDEQTRAFETIERAGRLGVDPILRALATMMFGQTTRRCRREIVVRWIEAAGRTNLEAIRSMALAALSQRDRASEMRNIRYPTLIVRGTEDPLVSGAEARRMAGGLPRGELCELARVGHLPSLEAPEALIDVLLSWRARSGRPTLSTAP